jgi:hypothetical protein
MLDRANFLARLEKRAQSLYADGYAVAPTEKLHVYRVSYQDGDGEKAYRVDPIAQTCTCPCFRWQALEPLSEDGAVVICKHLRGLSGLISRTLTTLKERQEVRLYYLLAAHWAGTRARMRREGERATDGQKPCTQCLIPECLTEKGERK